MSGRGKNPSKKQIIMGSKSQSELFLKGKEDNSAITSFEDDYRFLSNFWPVRIEYNGFVVPTLEHAYQMAKTNKRSEQKIIAEMETAGRAKRAGAKVSCREDWDEVKKGVMRELLEKKFQDPELKSLLLATEGKPIFEGNRWGDTFWGVDVETGQGSNNLGKLLEDQRRELKKKSYISSDTTS